jgi:hypothetical protein
VESENEESTKEREQRGGEKKREKDDGGWKFTVPVAAEMVLQGISSWLEERRSGMQLTRSGMGNGNGDGAESARVFEIMVDGGLDGRQSMGAVIKTERNNLLGVRVLPVSINIVRKRRQ